ncbi:MAG: DUF559 domain-containing protein [Armatimonadota bacterium]
MRWKKKILARHFRKNLTLPEMLLWNQLKSDQIGFRIRRQVPMGEFILDFYCANPKVAIEVDGSIHDLYRQQDIVRDMWLNSQGILVFRLSAKAVLKNPFTSAQAVRQFLEENPTGQSEV